MTEREFLNVLVDISHKAYLLALRAKCPARHAMAWSLGTAAGLLARDLLPLVEFEERRERAMTTYSWRG